MKKININIKDIVTKISIFVIFTETISYNFPFYWQFRLSNLILSFVLIWLVIELIRNFYLSLFIDFITHLIEAQKSPVFKLGMNAQRLFRRVLGNYRRRISQHLTSWNHPEKPRALARGGSFIEKTFCTLFLILLFFSSLTNLFLGNVTFPLLGKQLLGFLLHALVFYLLIEYNDRDIKKLFTTYLKIAFFIAVIGIIQECAYVTRNTLIIFFHYNKIIEMIFTPFYDFSYIALQGPWTLHYAVIFGLPFLRINSLMSEPSFFCIVLMPAFFVAFTSFNKNNFQFLSKKKSLVIIVAFLLSFSLVGYIGMLCSAVLMLFKSRRFILCLILPILLIVFSYRVVTPFKSRIPFLYNVLRGKIAITQADQSTFTWCLNSLVVYDNFKLGDFLLGRGLGSHEISYNTYIKKNNIGKPLQFNWLLNKEDANSLFLRLLSETGLFGLILFLVFITRNYINANRDPTHYLWIINNSILIFFIIRLIRQGNYFSEGFFFFIWLYYFSFKSYYSKLKQVNL